MIERTPPRTAVVAAAAPESRQRLRQLTRFTHALTRNPSLDDALPLIARTAARIIGSDRAALLLLDAEGRLGVRARVGLLADVAADDVRFDDQLQPQIEQFLGGPAYVTILAAHDHPMGVLAVARSDGRHDEDQWLLSVIADHAAIAIAYALEVKGAGDHLQAQIAQTLADANRRQLLMSTLTHDLRSPLLTIRMGAELVEKALSPTDNDSREVLGHMRVAAQYLEIMAQNLLQMGRLSAGAIRITPRQHAIEPVIEQAMAIVEPSASGRIEVDIPPRISAFTDPDRLRQVLANLLSNALKYVPGDSPVQVRVTGPGHREPHRVSIAVSDRGPGIATEEQESVFHPYYRLEDGGYTKAGAGLGLSIARELTRRMNGELTLQSQPGEGATFTVELPADGPDAE